MSLTERRHAFRGAGLALTAVTLVGCGPANVDEDTYALDACNKAVEARVPGQELLSTVRDEGEDAWVVNLWADEPAEGTPDFVCTAVRDADADDGVRVERIRP